MDGWMEPGASATGVKPGETPGEAQPPDDSIMAPHTVLLVGWQNGIVGWCKLCTAMCKQNAFRSTA